MDKENLNKKSFKNKLNILFKNFDYHSEALIICIIYSLAGGFWILLSDRILELLIKDPEIYIRIQTYKGWLYVCATAILIYVIINKRMRLIYSAKDEAVAAYDKLRTSHEDLLKMDKELRIQRDFVRKIIDESPVVIALLDMEGNLQRINPFGESLFGYEEKELLGENWISKVVPLENRSGLLNIIRLKEERTKDLEVNLISKDRQKISLLWSSNILNFGDQQLPSILAIGIDITERKKQEEAISYITFFDGLTNLPNRYMFIESGFELIDKNQENKIMAVVSINLDNFKHINDTLGHHIGDEFLINIGQSIKESIGTSGVVARTGGDEFGILFTKVPSKEELINEIENIKNNINKTKVGENQLFFITMSIGVAIYPDDGKDFDTLLKNADIAMHFSKDQGKDNIIEYREEIQGRNLLKTKMANNFKRAMTNQEFTLYYQPQYRLDSLKLIGFEALVRWIHPVEGFISPGVFIPILEETGQIFDLEQYVFKSALRQKKAWEDQQLNHLKLSINLSTKSLLSDIKFCELDNLLSSFNVDYKNIFIEVTETAIITNVTLAIERLEILRKRGLNIALDDFGTGYSSLTYLKSLPIDIVKLDTGFINSIPEDSKNTTIVQYVLSMSQELGYEVVAEGIEEKDQLQYLIDNKCDYGQGFLLNKPMSISSISKLLKDTKF